jgi:Domain of unknown function (DUF4760)
VLQSASPYPLVPITIGGGGSDTAEWLTLIVLAITAFFALRALYDARKTRHGQLIAELQRQWNDPAIVDAIVLHRRYTDRKLADLVRAVFDPAAEQPSDEQYADWSSLARWANLIESMGVLASEGVVTPDLIYKLWGGGILEAWSRWQIAVQDLRSYDGEPDTFQYFEELAAAMQAINEQRRALRAAADP